MRKILLPLLLTTIVIANWHAPVFAQTTQPSINQAGLVVVQGDGSVESRCVGFGEESINGLDLLARGGFTVRSDVTAMGASVCSVDGQGCGNGEDCFCQCQSSPCIYWTYWQRLPDGWRYSNAGPTTVQVQNGDMQGWVWGNSSANAAAETEPPALAFADICHVDAVVYGINAASDEGTSDAAASVPSVDNTMSQPWMVAVVIAAPLLLGGGWWLLQQRRKVQP